MLIKKYCYFHWLNNCMTVTCPVEEVCSAVRSACLLETQSHTKLSMMSPHALYRLSWARHHNSPLWLFHGTKFIVFSHTCGRDQPFHIVIWLIFSVKLSGGILLSAFCWSFCPSLSSTGGWCAARRRCKPFLLSMVRLLSGRLSSTSLQVCAAISIGAPDNPCYLINKIFEHLYFDDSRIKSKKVFLFSVFQNRLDWIGHWWATVRN